MRLVFDHEKEHPSRWGAVSSVAAKIGCTAQTLNEWVKKAEVDRGVRAGLPSDVAERLKALERENRKGALAGQLQREGFDVARCTISRLTQEMGLEGVIRGKRVCTAVSDKAPPCPLIRSTASFMSRRRTGFGSLTSPMSRPGWASSTWPSSSTPMPAASSAGGQAGQRMRVSCSMLSSRRSMTAVPPPAAWSLTATGYVSIKDALISLRLPGDECGALHMAYIAPHEDSEQRG